MSSEHSSNKRSGGYDSHELSSKSDAKPSRLGFRPVKDPYNVSVLRTQGNESEEEIIAGEQKNGFVRARSGASGQRETEPGGGIVIKREVDVSSENGKQDFQRSWRPV